MPASRAKTIRLIARKELTDLLRDRRTIITALVVPLVSFPLLFSVIGFFASPVSNPSQIAVQNLDGAGASQPTSPRRSFRLRGSTRSSYSPLPISPRTSQKGPTTWGS
jgi:hypothetical protein